MKQGLTYQLTERKGAADGHSAAVPLHRPPEGKIYESIFFKYSDPSAAV